MAKNRKEAAAPDPPRLPQVGDKVTMPHIFWRNKNRPQKRGLYRGVLIMFVALLCAA
jgi:hypothetical protein